MSDPRITLADLMSCRPLLIDEALEWSASLAVELVSLHELGLSHDAIGPANILIDAGHATLGPGAAADDAHSSSHSSDMVAFAVLLHQIANHVAADTDPIRALCRSLNSIADSAARAASAGQMKKVAAALRLLRASRKLSLPAPLRVTAPPPNPNRFYARTIHVWAFLGSAAGLAALGCVLFFKILR